MRTTRTVSALAGSVLLAMSLVGCSEAEKAAEDAKGKAADAANSAKEKAGEEGKKAAEDAKKKLGDKAKKAAEDAKKKAGDKAGSKTGASGDKSGDKAGNKAGGAGGASGMTVELGEFAGDKNAEAAAGFFKARHVALASDGSDTADLKATTTPEQFKKSSAFVKKNAGKQKATTVTVVGVEGGSVNVCAGPKGTNARTLTIEGGKVAANAKGQHTCQ